MKKIIYVPLFKMEKGAVTESLPLLLEEEIKGNVFHFYTDPPETPYAEIELTVRRYESKYSHERETEPDSSRATLHRRIEKSIARAELLYHEAGTGSVMGLITSIIQTVMEDAERKEAD